ncbi:barstar family protein [Candidatus Poribacteria bacterium]|nr:barstar family protein [Candidatus Poribacteria bacterium]
MDKQISWKICFNNMSAPPIHIINDTQEIQEIPQGYKLFKLHGHAIESKEAFFHLAAKEMSFPDYFGNNWDALEECMRDVMEWIPARGYIVLFEDAHLFCQSAPNDFLTFIEIVAGIADEWAHEGIPLFLILAGAVSLRTFNYGPLKKRICIHPR